MFFGPRTSQLTSQYCAVFIKIIRMRRHAKNPVAKYGELRHDELYAVRFGDGANPCLTFENRENRSKSNRSQAGMQFIAQKVVKKLWYDHSNSKYFIINEDHRCYTKYMSRLVNFWDILLWLEIFFPYYNQFHRYGNNIDTW